MSMELEIAYSKIAHYTMSEADLSSLLQSMKKELNGDMFSITVPSMGMKLRTTAKTNYDDLGIITRFAYG